MNPSLRTLLGIAALLVFVIAGNAFEATAPRPPSTDAMGNPITAFPEGIISTAKAIGFLLLGGWMLGQLASNIGLSKITGYLVFGLLSSPRVGAWILGADAQWVISPDQQTYLLLVNDLAIALIALTAGGKIDLAEVRKGFRAVSLILAAEFTLVLLTISALMTVLLARSGVFDDYGGLGTAILVAIVIGVVATANSPAVVIAIIGETRARGIMTSNALAITVCKDLLLIIVFAIALALATNAARNAFAEAPSQESRLIESEAGADDDTPDVEATRFKPSDPVWLKLLRQVGGSLLAGALLGVVLAWYLRHSSANLPIVLTLGSFAIALISEQLGLKTLIVGLAAGLMVANRYKNQKATLFDAVQDLSVPVYILFFAVAGTKIDPALLGEVWFYVLALVGLRTLSIWSGTAIGVKLSGLEPPASRWIWTAFVPQAGISLALAVVVAEQFEGLGFSEKVYAILLSSIAIHELAGPVLFKLGLNRAGETHTDPMPR